jgi:hypothetical protein
MTILDQSAFKAEGSSETSIGKQFADNGIQCTRGDKDKDSGLSIVKALLGGTPGNTAGDWVLLISDKCPEIHTAFKSFEYGQHEPDELAALRYVLVAMHRRGIFSVNGKNFHHEEENTARAFNPMSIFDQRRLREKEEEDLAWDSDTGCFN